MESIWLSSVKRLHALAESGLAFCKNDYDIERYEEIALIARQLLTTLVKQPISDIEVILKQPVRRYVTPQVEVRGAVFNQNKILLVKEVSDGKWTLPGGYADVGLSPVENVEKEIIEEAGIGVKTLRLFALRHKARGDYDADIRDFYKLFFVCEPQSLDISTGIETSDVGFFSQDELPNLSTGRINLRDINDAFEAHLSPNAPLKFE